MKIVVFGSTGGTGSRVIERGLAEGHEMIAVARRPEAVATKHERLRVVKGDALDPASVEAAIAGADAIVSTIGPADNKNPGTLISRGIANMVAAAKKTGVRRLVFESGLMVGDGRGLSFVSRVGLSIYRRMNRALCDDKRVAEETLRTSDLDWVIVRPPALAHGPAKGDYVSGVDAPISAAKTLPHADCAAFLVRAATEAELARTVQTVGRK